MARLQPKGALLFGLPVMASDGTLEDVADTPQNAPAFGRQSGDRGEGAFPQIQGVYLVDCGTHAIVDAGFSSMKSIRTSVWFVVLYVACSRCVSFRSCMDSYSLILLCGFVCIRQRCKQIVLLIA
jgi:hypothetical protein